MSRRHRNHGAGALACPETRDSDVPQWEGLPGTLVSGRLRGKRPDRVLLERYDGELIVVRLPWSIILHLEYDDQEYVFGVNPDGSVTVLIDRGPGVRQPHRFTVASGVFQPWLQKQLT